MWKKSDGSIDSVNGAVEGIYSPRDSIDAVIFFRAVETGIIFRLNG